ncbi:MAG: hypothetical protein F4Y38_08335 [Gemmatimonadetes bacterium]|nr:hypothetical protein [Gemmatimonadota bacterium]MYG84493.1 hypothetical protein [Gemmatimonadota bacterium]MYJ91380.1 hypothetical protein [Gemmatimonadota bacterium]
MNKLVLAALITAGMVFHASVAYAGGWTQPQGKGYFKLSQQIIRAESLFLATGSKTEIPTVSGYTTGLYGEFGLIDRVTLVGYMPVYTNFSIDIEGFDSTTGLGDWDVGVRIGLLTGGPTVVSLQALAGLPLGDSGGDIVLWSGDGEFNQHFSLQVGHSLYPVPAYLKGEIGYNNRKSSDSRDDNYADELRYSLQAGYTIAERVGVALSLRGIKALDRADDEFHPRNDVEYLSYGPQVDFYVTPNAGITASMTRFTRAHNMLDAPTWEFGVFLKL